MALAAVALLAADAYAPMATIGPPHAAMMTASSL